MMENQVEKAKNARRYQPVSEDLVEQVKGWVAEDCTCICCEPTGIAPCKDCDALESDIKKLIALIRPVIEREARNGLMRSFSMWLDIESKRHGNKVLGDAFERVGLHFRQHKNFLIEVGESLSKEE